jgi:hypothetical protein
MYIYAPAYFALKGTQTKRSATRGRNNEAKGDAPGLKSSGVSLVSGSEGPNWALSNNLGNFLFLLLNPDSFFWRQRASAKGCSRAFFLGWCS